MQKNTIVPNGEKIIFNTNDPLVNYTQEVFEEGFIFAKVVSQEPNVESEIITLPDMTQYEKITTTTVVKRQIGTTFTGFTI